MPNRRLLVHGNNSDGSPPSISQSRRLGNTNAAVVFSYNTGPTNGRLLVIISCCIQTRTEVGPAGWSKYVINPPGQGTIVIWWKFANAESNSYTFSFSGGTYNINVHGFEFTGAKRGPVPAGFRSNAQSSVISGNAGSSNLDAPKNSLLIAHGVSFNTSSGGFAWNNSFTNIQPAAGVNTFASTAYRQYSSFAAAQNSQYTIDTNRNVVSALFKIV